MVTHGPDTGYYVMLFALPSQSLMVRPTSDYTNSQTFISTQFTPRTSFSTQRRISFCQKVKLQFPG